MKKFALTLAISSVAYFALVQGSKCAVDEESDDNPIDGAWRWSFTMPDGTRVHPKLILTNQNGHLLGSTTFRPGAETGITNGSLVGNRIRFQVVRYRDQEAITTTYSGVWNGPTIQGTLVSDWTGRPETYPWLAERTHFGVEGTWTWTNSLSTPRQPGDAPRATRLSSEIPTRVTLRQDGNVVKGRSPSRSGRPIPILNGSITNGEVQFQIEKSSRETKHLLTYRGKQSGETITGTVEIELNGKIHKGTWDAKRVD